ncbi:unnamed protein product [Sphagnum tenellum]
MTQVKRGRPIRQGHIRRPTDRVRCCCWLPSGSTHSLADSSLRRDGRKQLHDKLARQAVADTGKTDFKQLDRASERVSEEGEAKSRTNSQTGKVHSEKIGISFTLERESSLKRFLLRRAGPPPPSRNANERALSSFVCG